MKFRLILRRACTANARSSVKGKTKGDKEGGKTTNQSPRWQPVSTASANAGWGSGWLEAARLEAFQRQAVWAGCEIIIVCGFSAEIKAQIISAICTSQVSSSAENYFGAVAGDDFGFGGAGGLSV